MSINQHTKHRRIDDWVGRVLTVLASVGGLLLLLILAFLLQEAMPILDERGLNAWLNSEGWYPSENQLNMMPMVWGSLAVTLGALLVAAPMAYCAALYAAFYASPNIASGFRSLMAVLAGIPSVVFGLWGLTTLVPLIAQWQPPGASVLAATLVLGLMILPTIMLTSEAALRAVPDASLLAAAALGLSHRALIFQVVWPQAKHC